MIARSRGVDIRLEGSGNPGATNVGRVLGKPFGIACFFLDAIKGAVPVLLSGWLAGILGTGSNEMTAPAAWGWLLVAIMTILGHCFSPWIGFRGGKGVATGFGAVLAMWPVLTMPAIAAFVVWGLVLLVTRVMSLASIVGSLVLPATVLAMAVVPDTPGANPGASIPFLVVTSLVSALIVFRHRGNLARLQQGRENRLGTEGSDSAGSSGD
ncbi:MAG: acyl-phosphate glycerol 3-phosphate acyltransferase [Phycisphaerae bacterium]|nr:acyl-phosphate glycerol 3-phosphate acyltransferase [Phycisphaerae bacterium]